MQRIEAVRAVVSQTTGEDLFVGVRPSGMFPEFYTCLEHQLENSFWISNLGSITPCALGLAVAMPHRRIIALDTDGSMIMNTGALCTVGNMRPPNLTIVVFDNGVYESVGGPATLTGRGVDLARMAEGAGCINCVTCTDTENTIHALDRMLNDSEMGILVAKVAALSDKPPRQRSVSGTEGKFRFIRYVEQLEGIAILPALNKT